MVEWMCPELVWARAHERLLRSGGRKPHSPAGTTAQDPSNLQRQPAWRPWVYIFSNL